MYIIQHQYQLINEKEKNNAIFYGCIIDLIVPLYG